MLYDYLFNILLFIISSLILWIVFYRSKVISNNDFWDYIFILFIFTVIGYKLLSYNGVIIFGILGTLIFSKLKSYSYYDIFDFYALFLSIFFILDFISQGFIYFLIILLVSICIILLRKVVKGYGMVIFLLIYSVMYFLNHSLWIFHKNYIYNLDLDVIFIFMSLLFLGLKLFFSNENNDYSNILKHKI